MKFFTPKTSAAVTLVSMTMLTASAAFTGRNFDLTKMRYQIDSPSVFNNSRSRDIERLNARISAQNDRFKAETANNPAPSMTLPTSNAMGNIDAPNGELWYYSGTFEYTEIPPHDNVAYTDYILQSYKFEIFDQQMKSVGTIYSKVEYGEGEIRVPMCDITPVATRNFFNTDDKIEIIVSMAFNLEDYGNNYRSYVYSLNGEKDNEGNDKPVATLHSLVGDVIEGPASADGSDNFFITFMEDKTEDIPDDATFWDYLLAQYAEIDVYGKAINADGPRLLFEKKLPLIQLPGDQESVPPIMSMLNGNDVVFMLSYYKEPFFNRYDDPFSEEMTMRENNHLVIELYKATEQEFEKTGNTEIAISLDPMKDADGNATCLFSYYSVGALRYKGDILFDAPGTQPGKPDYIITRGNYIVTVDGVINSYFTYKYDGTLKNTLFEYADGTLQMGDIAGFEPQQMFVSLTELGYHYHFVDLYSGNTVANIDANYYLEGQEDPDLLTANLARTPVGDSYKYVFEMRYPLLDDNDNDIMRFIYLDKTGKFDHIEEVNMGRNVDYAMSYLSTEALADHAYSLTPGPAYMLLIKRRQTGTDTNEEQLMIAEPKSGVSPDGRTLLLLSPNANGALSGIIPEFATEKTPGRLLIYYKTSQGTKDFYTLDVYDLPLAGSGVDAVTDDAPEFIVDGTMLKAEGEIKVFALDGSIVSAGRDAVEFASLPSGLYIVSVNGKSCKILK